MALSDNDLFVVQDPTDSKFYKLTVAELSAKAADDIAQGAATHGGTVHSIWIALMLIK